MRPFFLKKNDVYWLLQICRIREQLSYRRHDRTKQLVHQIVENMGGTIVHKTSPGFLTSIATDGICQPRFT